MTVPMTSEPTSSPTPRVRTRPVRLPFEDEGIPKHWLAGNATATAVSNGVNLLFPYGERFFVRSVKHYVPMLEAKVDESPEGQRRAELLKQIKGFFGQEGRHAREHERFFDILRGQGYELDGFLARFERAFGQLERVTPPSFHLAATAAGEHFTALMAGNAFRDLPMFDHAHPLMRDLMLWHAAEEIEHKAVAFDVLTEAVPSPVLRYLVRISGMAVASAFLLYWWTQGTKMLLAQDGVDRRRAVEEGERFQALRRALGLPNRRIVRDVFLRGIASYLRPSFHPWEVEDAHVAASFLADFEARRLA